VCAHIQVDISGAILTKMDGDSRGGAALSVREVRDPRGWFREYVRALNLMKGMWE
jgi:hypothetical protein